MPVAVLPFDWRVPWNVTIRLSFPRRRDATLALSWGKTPRAPENHRAVSDFPCFEVAEARDT